MATSDSSWEEPDRVARMLAEMDSRLQLLQQELESLALPTPLRPEQPQRVALNEPPGLPWAAPERPTRTPLARMPSPPALRMADLPADLRKRAARQVAALPGERSAPVTGQNAPPTSPEPAALSIVPDSVVRQAILEADQEVRRVVEDARRRIADIGVRTRALLEHPPTSPPDAALAIARSSPEVTSTPLAHEQREYDGTVTVEAGPFGDIVQLNDFESALSSIPGIEDVYIRTFERHRAHFELRVVEPTLLIAELRDRASDSLHVIEASERDIRLEIVEDETDRPASR